MSNSAENHYDILSPYAPQMPKPLPQMLHLAIKNAPEHMKAAISNSLFPAFGSLMHNVGFRYPDNVFHEPHFINMGSRPLSDEKLADGNNRYTFLLAILLNCAATGLQTM